MISGGFAAAAVMESLVNPKVCFVLRCTTLARILAIDRLGLFNSTSRGVVRVLIFRILAILDRAT